MRITAITRFKEATIHALLRKLNWSQSELARRSGIHPVTVGEFINLRRKPTQEQANKIQTAFGEAGEFVDVVSLWPESFNGFRESLIIEQTKEVPEHLLLDFMEHERSRLLDQPIVDFGEDGIGQDMAEKVPYALSLLPQRHQSILKDRVLEELTYDEIGAKHGVTRERVRQIVLESIRKTKYRVTRAEKSPARNH